jgi:uncharacterized protein (DUF433 family)
MSFTVSEILETMKVNLTPAEIAEGLELSSDDLVEELAEYIKLNYDKAVACLRIHGIELGGNEDGE